MKHGTKSGYTAGCRNECCRSAKALASKRERARAGADSFVPAEPSRKHLAKLGLSHAVAAQVLGLSLSAVQKLSYGQRKYLRRSTAQKILFLNSNQIDPQLRLKFVSAENTREMLEDLYSSGFTNRELAQKLGLRTSLHIRYGRVRPWNEKRIEQLYRTLGTKAA